MKFPLPPHRLPGLERLLSGAAWNEWSSQGLTFPVDDFRGRVEYVRLKPDDSCRLTVFSEPDRWSSPPVGARVELYASALRSAEVFEKEQSRRHWSADGREPFHCPATAAVVVPFPNDNTLPFLRHAYEPDRFRRALAEVLPDFDGDQWRIKRRSIESRLIAYKPDRRAVLRTNLELRAKETTERRRIPLHLKITNPSVAEELFAKIEVFSSGLRDTQHLRVAKALGVARGTGLVATEWVDGVDLRRYVADSESSVDVFDRVGRALAELHHQDVDVGHRPSPIERVDELTQLTEDLVRLLPSEESTLRRLGDVAIGAVSRWVVEPSAIVHGDFHLGQILVEEDHSKLEVTLIDFDQAGRGYALEDLGEFLASLWEFNLPNTLRESFLRAYQRRGVTHSEQDLHDAAAVALFRRASFPFRTLVHDWPHEVRRRCEQIHRWFAGGRT